MVEVFYYDAFQKTINPEHEGGPLVRHSVFAELAAENERLKRAIADANADRDRWYESSFRASALASIGEVNVKAIDADRRAKEAADAIGVTPYSDMRLFVEQAVKYALSVLESTLPEGQQEPVAERGVDFVNAINNGTVRINKEMVPEYTRPSEQAVTEAGIETASRLITEWMGYSWDGLGKGRITDKGFPVWARVGSFNGRQDDMRDLARAALKAALEARG